MADHSDPKAGPSEGATDAIAGQVTVYSISGCPHCRRAKATLSKKKIPYVEINLDIYSERRAEMVERTGRRTVPQIFFNHKHIGGSDDLHALSEDELTNLFNYVTETSITEGTPSAPKSIEANDASSDNQDIKCEEDQLIKLVNAIRDPDQGVEIKDRMYRLRQYHSCFVGSALVDWLVVRMEAKNRDEAVELGNQMMGRHFFHHVTHDHAFKDENLFYRFLSDEKTKALNGGELSTCEPDDPSAAGEKLRRLILAIYEEFLSEDGTQVDYEGIGKSEAFRRYCDKAKELQRVNLSKMTRFEKIAFFINIYNALVIHATVVKGAPSSSWQRAKFFSTVSYIIGGNEYSLQAIENGVLRANRPGPFQFRPPFSKNDPRAPLALQYPEPRVHFALVCGAKSCPPIKTYRAANVDEQLTAATQAFFEGEALQIKPKSREVYLSKILDWYAPDFGRSSTDTLHWVLSFATGEKQTQLADLLTQKKSVKLSFLPYDWGSNKK